VSTRSFGRTIAAAFFPKDVIARMSDFKTNEYADLIGGRAFEPKEANPMLGFRGASRYYDPKYQDCFALECRAMKKVREEMGLKNIKLVIPFCRAIDEGLKVIAEIEKNDLKKREHGLEFYVMCEVPSNVILAKQFCNIFDGFSIGSNDLTQLLLGVDRDSAIVAHDFDERNDAVKIMISQVIRTAHSKGKKIGICGQAPNDYPEFAKFLIENKIDSVSLNPDVVIKTTMDILKIEKSLVDRSQGGTQVAATDLSQEVVVLLGKAIGTFLKRRGCQRTIQANSEYRPQRSSYFGNIRRDPLGQSLRGEIFFFQPIRR
jgi:pyruvate, water dikinase